MDPIELKHAIERARALREDVRAVRRMYEEPVEMKSEAPEAEIARELFTELMNNLQSLAAELEELLPRREIQMGEERMVIRTALPSSIRQYFQPEANLLILQGSRMRSILEDIIRRLGWIPPWITPWPWPWHDPGDELLGGETDEVDSATT